jgi:hypothetical protein
MLCRYRDIFGKVGEGAHSYKIFNIAVIDVILTVLIGLLIHSFFPKYRLIYILLALFASGVILHRLFCVRTSIDKLLFPESRDSHK